MSENHRIQYNDGYGRMSTVLCKEHRPELFDYLKRYSIGCVGTIAPESAKCDQCKEDS